MKQDDLTHYFSVHRYGRDRRKMVYVFGGWKSVPVYHLPVVRRLFRLGYGMVLFVPRRDIIGIGRPYQHIVDASNAAVAEAMQQMEVDKQRGVTEFVSFGISLGTLFAAELAKQSPDIGKLVLVAPFGIFAEHVELWPDHWYFGRILASQPTNRVESGEVLAQIGIEHNIGRLRDIPVFIGHSDRDKHTHTPVVVNMIDVLQEGGVDVRRVMVRGGHLRAVITLMAFHPGFVRFLREN